MLIREARPEDAPAIAHVHVESWRTTYHGIVAADYLAGLSIEERQTRWAEMLRHPARDACSFIAEDPSGAVIGFASGGPARDAALGYEGDLYAIYLLDVWQGQGIGRQLAAAVAERLAGSGLRSLLVWVLADNPARGFYETLGGQKVVEREVQIGGQSLAEVGYGWTDINVLLARARAG
jgi:GNAT superfamily N-acetyltransferase